nr:MAG TPA: hypothetical protein [Bacteriophage sp.]
MIIIVWIDYPEICELSRSFFFLCARDVIKVQEYTVSLLKNWQQRRL